MSTQASLTAFNEAKELIPGGVNSPVRAFSSVGGSPIFIAEGEGGYLKDIDGNKYVDLFSHGDHLFLVIVMKL